MKNKLRKITYTGLVLEWLSWAVFFLISVLQRCCRAISRNASPFPLAAANEETPSATADLKTIAAANEFSEVQKDSLFIPFGEYPVTVQDPSNNRKAECLQVFDLVAANEISNQLSGLKGVIAGALRLLPIYIGHPDVPQFAEKYKDSKAYGWITGVNAITDKGIELSVKWSRAGEELIEQGHYMFYSPYWLMRPIGVVNSILRARPGILRSIGLTNQPAIPVPAIAVAGVNEFMDGAEAKIEQEEIKIDPPPPVPTLLQRLAALLGLEEIEEVLVAKIVELMNAVAQVKAAAEAKEESLNQEWKAKEAAMQAAANEAATRLQDLTAANEKLTGDLAAISTMSSNVKAEYQVEQQARLAACNELVQAGIAGGVIPGGKADEWISAFNEDFAGTLAKLKGTPILVPSGSRTRSFGGKRPGATAPTAQFLAAVNEHCDKTGAKFENAWLFIQRTRSDLLSGMESK